MRKNVLACLSALLVFMMVEAWNVIADSSVESENSTTSEKLLSRRKRYIVFPKGSSLQLVFCFTQFIPQTTFFKLGTTAGLAWMLPDNPNVFLDKKHQKFKRSIYTKVEGFMNLHDVNGKECILRALCESGQRTSSKKPFVQEVLHKIFSLGSDAEMEDEVYLKAHRSVNSNCTTLYPDCPFSLFDI